MNLLYKEIFFTVIWLHIFVVNFTLGPRWGWHHWGWRNCLALNSANDTNTNGHNQQNGHNGNLKEKKIDKTGKRSVSRLKVRNKTELQMVLWLRWTSEKCNSGSSYSSPINQKNKANFQQPFTKEQCHGKNKHHSRQLNQG